MSNGMFLLFVFMTEWETVWPHTVPTCMVDLTHGYNENIPFWPGSQKFSINRSLGDKPDGTPPGFRTEVFASPTHMGTHIDAPCHIVGNSLTVTDISLKNLMGVCAVVLDVTNKVAADPDYTVKIGDLLDWERQYGFGLYDTVLLIRTGWSKKWPSLKDYVGNSDNDVQNMHFPGISEEAARWLVLNRTVYGIGIDTLSLDCGQCKSVPSHQIWLGNNKYCLENLNDLDKLPAYGITLNIMPMKLLEACGAPCRVVATFTDTNSTCRDA